MGCTKGLESVARIHQIWKLSATCPSSQASPKSFLVPCLDEARCAAAAIWPYPHDALACPWIIIGRCGTPSTRSQRQLEGDCGATFMRCSLSATADLTTDILLCGLRQRFTSIIPARCGIASPTSMPVLDAYSTVLVLVLVSLVAGRTKEGQRMPSWMGLGLQCPACSQTASSHVMCACHVPRTSSMSKLLDADLAACRLMSYGTAFTVQPFTCPGLS